MNAEILLETIVTEAERFFGSYPRGVVYSQFKSCRLFY
jgi:hypothetical protein